MGLDVNVYKEIKLQSEDLKYLFKYANIDEDHNNQGYIKLELADFSKEYLLNTVMKQFFADYHCCDISDFQAGSFTYIEPEMYLPLIDILEQLIIEPSMVYAFTTLTDVDLNNLYKYSLIRFVEILKTAREEYTNKIYHDYWYFQR